MLSLHELEAFYGQTIFNAINILLDAYFSPGRLAGAIIGFILLGITVFVVVPLIIYCCCCRKKKSSVDKQHVGYEGSSILPICSHWAYAVYLWNNSKHVNKIYNFYFELSVAKLHVKVNKVFDFPSEIT